MANPLNPTLHAQSGTATRYVTVDGTAYISQADGTVHSVLDRHVSELLAHGFGSKHPRELTNPNNGNQLSKWGNG